MARLLRQQRVLDDILDRASRIESIDGVILIGSFAAGQPDDLSDLDLVAVAAPDRLDHAWNARYELAGDVLVTWEPQPSAGRDIRWLNWLTHDLVKVECGVAAPGSKELAEPFTVVCGPASLADRFACIDRTEVERRGARRRDRQEHAFDPESLTPEERLGWALSEVKRAARALLRA